MHREFSRSGLALVLIVGLLVRVGFVAYLWKDTGLPTSVKDPDDYGRLALNLVKTGTYGFPVEASDGDRGTNPANNRGNDRAKDRPNTLEPQSEPSEDDAGAIRMRPTAYRPPLYPALLTAAVLPDLARGVPLSQVTLNSLVVVGLHILLGLATIGMVYYIAWRLDFRFGWLPAMAVAADPILLHFSGEMMTETLITFLAAWAWALYLILVRPGISEKGRRIWGMNMSVRVALLLGLVLGLAVLTRPTMLPWAILIVASLSLRGNDSGNRVSVITAALIVMTVINAGWMIRNNQELGKPIWTTTHGGYTLLLANNPPLYEHWKAKGPDREWDADAFHSRWAMRRSGDPTSAEFWQRAVPGDMAPPDIDELKDDRLAQEAAIATIKNDPQTFALGCLYRAGWLWQVFPNVDDQQQVERVVIAVWYGLWFVMAVLGLIWLREALTSRVWFMPLLLVITLTGIHMIYWSNMRMRAPLMPVVYMIACWPLMRARTPSRV